MSGALDSFRNYQYLLMTGAPVQLKRYTSEVLMVCTTGLNLMLLPTRVFVPSKISEMSFRWYQAARYSVFMNQPGELMPKKFRLFSTPPPTNQPLRLKLSVWTPTGRPLRSNIEVPDQWEPV